jgi:L-aminopeptidase/D-esterase-like protein
LTGATIQLSLTHGILKIRKREGTIMSKISRRQFGQTLAASGGVSLLRPLASAFANSSAPEAASPGGLTDVPGIKVGHFTDTRRPTGCTAILFDPEATAAVDWDGSAPGEQMAVMLTPVSSVSTIHGMLLTGGGVPGLAAVAGAVQYLQDQKIGFHWGPPDMKMTIPIVVGAVISDVGVGDGSIRPDPEAAYKACQAASAGTVAEGNVGAGAGATVGKMLRGIPGMKAGLGTASLRLGEVVIAALVVINAVGDVLDWRTGRIIAGARRADGKGFANTMETMKADVAAGKSQASLEIYDPPFNSTNLVVVATNVSFTKTEMTKIALMANCGASRAIVPYHTTGDGDQLYALSTNKLKTDVPISTVGALAGEVAAEAIDRGIKTATSIEGWPAYRDYTTKL